MRKKYQKIDGDFFNIRAKSSRVLKALLKGKTINRKTLRRMKISDYNDSAHSYVSHLKNKRYIPIQRQLTSDGTCNYSMSPEEIQRYNDPVLRKQQSDEIRTQVEHDRRNRFLKCTENYLYRLEKNPDIWQFISDLPEKLQLIINKIDAILRNKNGIN